MAASRENFREYIMMALITFFVVVTHCHRSEWIVRLRLTVQRDNIS